MHVLQEISFIHLLMTVDVLAFGIAKEIFGKTVVTVDVTDSTVATLRKTLEASFPKLGQIASYMVAVNNEYATNDLAMNASDEIAIIPPVSGG